jgi:hypothetical protein
MSKEESIKYGEVINYIDSKYTKELTTTQKCCGQYIRNKLCIKRLECAKLDVYFALERFQNDENKEDEPHKELVEIYKRLEKFLIKQFIKDELIKSSEKIATQIDKDILNKLSKNEL